MRHMESTHDYAETAYRGEPSAGPSEGHRPEDQSWQQNQIRKTPLPRLGPQCAEYLEGHEIDGYEAANPKSQEGRMLQHAGGLIWPTMRNPYLLLTIVKGCSWFFLFVGVFAFCVALLSVGESLVKKSDIYGLSHLSIFFLVFLLPPLLVVLTSSLLIRVPGLGKVGNIVFFRSSGKVKPHKKSGHEPLSFREFDPYIYEYHRGTGGMGIKLILGHRYHDLAILCPREEVGDAKGLLLQWELTQHYMDVNYPIPDLPEYEPFRGADPVTREHDRRRGRPPYWWRNMGVKQMRALKNASSEAARAYPWGKTREEAKAEGWQPSIYSQVLFEEASYDDLMAFLAEADPNNADNIRAAEPVG